MVYTYEDLTKINNKILKLRQLEREIELLEKEYKQKISFIQKQIDEIKDE